MSEESYFPDYPVRLTEDEAARQCAHHLVMAYMFAEMADCDLIEAHICDIGQSGRGGTWEQFVMRSAAAFIEEVRKIDAELKDEFPDEDEPMEIRLVFPGEGNA